jgi:hypothetical protein
MPGDFVGSHQFPRGGQAQEAIDESRVFPAVNAGTGRNLMGPIHF